MYKNQWQKALTDLIKDPQILFDYLELDQNLLEGAYKAIKSFPLRVPRGFAARMQKGDPNDPLLRQVLPLKDELISHPGYTHDPLKEAEVNPVPGLLHKYHGRVLVTLTSACAVHCRYCFRRHFPYENNNPGKRGWGAIVAYIENQKTIQEVILSGGDPLTLNDDLLEQFSIELTNISHIKRLRIHTRVPIVLPERITSNFCGWLKQTQHILQTVIVVHANHPQEINGDVNVTLAKLRQCGVTLLNQSVLLKGINDDAKVLAALSEKLFAANVLPYYLHILDKVSGAAHFDIDIEKARSIHAELRALLPGYLVPRLVREDASMDCKTML